jgi:hypothetical protein
MASPKNVKRKKAADRNVFIGQKGTAFDQGAENQISGLTAAK